MEDTAIELRYNTLSRAHQSLRRLNLYFRGILPASHRRYDTKFKVNSVTVSSLDYLYLRILAKQISSLDTRIIMLDSGPVAAVFLRQVR
jgi:hypothetical protein